MSLSVSKSNATASSKKFLKDHVFDIDHILLFGKALDTPTMHRKTNPKGAAFYVAKTKAEVAPLVRAFPERAKYFSDYISQGITSFFVTKDDVVVAYLFGTTKDFYDRHLWKNTVHVKEGQFFHFAGYVVPANRGSMIALFTLQQMHGFLAQQGISEVITTISARNEPSWRLCLKVGYDQRDQAWDVYKCLGFRWSRETPVRSWVH